MNKVRTTLAYVGVGMVFALTGCQLAPTEPEPSPQQRLIDRGRALFFEETFAGNGRTCGSCHPVDNNFTIDPKSIAGLGF